MISLSWATCPFWRKMIYIQGRPAHTLTRSISWATSPQTHTGLFSRVTYPHMFILVYFQGRPTHMVYFHGRPALPLTVIYFHGRPPHTCSSWSIFRGDRPTWSIFMGDPPFHSHWSIFTGDLPTHVYPGLFLGATGPHGLFSWATRPSTHTDLFSRVTYPHMFILVYFQGRPAPWSIFMGDLPFHSHWSIFTGDLPTHVYPGLFSGATGPHTHMVYFHWRPALTLTLVYFTGDLPTCSHGLFSWATCPHTHTDLFSRATYPLMFILLVRFEFTSFFFFFLFLFFFLLKIS